MRTETPHLQQKQKPRTSAKKITRDLQQLDWQLYPRAKRPSVPYIDRQSDNNPNFYRWKSKIRKRKRGMKYRMLLLQDQRYRDRKAGRMKMCTDCLRFKAHADFDKQMDHRKNMLRPYCKKCRSIRNAEAYQKRKNK